MHRIMLLPLLLAGLLATNRAHAAGGWPALKRGMTPAQALAALGKPLIQTSGRDFDLWIYDQQTEVLFFRGPVVAWTAPGGTARNEAAGAGHDAFEWPVLRLPHKVIIRPLPPADATPGDLLPTSSFLYQGRR